MVVGRYAPSPTGFLHLGNVRTALLAWLHARAKGGRFVLRIEDIDRGRSQARFEQAAIEDLRWLGLDWDEGPDVGGKHAPYRQSLCDEVYRAALERVPHYPCGCTRAELAQMAVRTGTSVYDGTCKGKSPAWVAARCVPPREPAIRLHVQAAQANAAVPTLMLHDAQLGQRTVDGPTAVGDLVLRRSDGNWAYALAVVVDDARMGVSDVVRGADLWPVTPAQVLLQRVLGLPTPGYVHVPLLRGDDGEKLSKRHRAPDVRTLRTQGVQPDEVVGVLAASVGLVPWGTRCMPSALDWPRARLQDVVPAARPTWWP